MPNFFEGFEDLDSEAQGGFEVDNDEQFEADLRRFDASKDCDFIDTF